MRNWGREQRTTDRAADGAGPQLPGVIDTLGFAYAALALRPLVILPLLLLDLCLLFAPQLTLNPVADDLAIAMRRQGDSWDNVAGEAQQLEGYTVLELVTLRIPMVRTPAIVPVFDDGDVERLPWSVRESNTPSWGLVIVGAVVVAIGLLVSASYRRMAAGVATGVGALREALDPRDVRQVALSMVGWVVALTGLFLLVAMPVLVASGVGALFGFPEIAVISLVLTIPFVWGYVHFYFSIPAIALDRSGPLTALRSSYRVVRGHFWQSIQFIAVSLLISTGLTYALQSMAANAFGAVLAIVINAVVASGLIVAATLFYRDRAVLLGPVSTDSGR